MISNKNFVFSKPQNNSREFFIDFLKTICIVLVVIVNTIDSESIEFKQCGGYYWAGQAIPIFLIITGFLYARSADYTNRQTLKEQYDPRYIFSKLVRYLLPYCFCIVVELILLACNGCTSFTTYLFNFLGGGDGPGTYYFWTILQIVLIYPLIFELIKKFKFNGLFITFAISLLWDVLQQFAFNLNEGTYKYIVFRFVFIVSFGSYLYMSIKENTKYKWYFAIPSFCIGIVFMSLVYYMNLPMHVCQKWFKYCEVSNLFIIPIISLLIRNFKMKKQWWWSIIGKATFNIYLTQKVFLRYLPRLWLTTDFFTQTLINELIILPIGLLFWQIEAPITNFVTNKIRNKK